MNWFQLINKATSYIEENISDNITSKDVASHCNVSYQYFTRTFSLVTGYSLMEYIRNRRVTLASYDISNTNEKIIDIAIKYGYSSNEAFSRAFKKIHGINPSEARKKNIAVFTHFPILHYDIPKPNMISLRYEIDHDLEMEFIGKSTYIVELNYEETQQSQLKFVNDFLKAYPSKERYYKVHHNLSYDDMRYDYFVGYLSDGVSSTNLSTLVIRAEKVIRFISKNVTKEIIPQIKKIIYDEWQKNKFLASGECEIEYTVANVDGTEDFYYVVSIV